MIISRIDNPDFNNHSPLICMHRHNIIHLSRQISYRGLATRGKPVAEIHEIWKLTVIQ